MLSSEDVTRYVRRAQHEPLKGATVFDDQETVNGVLCKGFKVDADLDYTRHIGSQTTGHAKGTMWVAAQARIPPVVVGAVMEEDLVVDDGPSHPYR